MHFYLDEDLSDAIARLGRRRGLDVTSSHEVGRDHYTDVEQLAHAAREGRCLVTKNGTDFRGITAECEVARLPHAGVLTLSSSFDGSEYNIIVEMLERWDELYPDGLPPYFFGYL